MACLAGSVIYLIIQSNKIQFGSVDSSGKGVYDMPDTTHENNHSSLQYQKDRIILFGAIGRHNFGDVLFPEVFLANLKNTCDISSYELIFADILPRNMSKYGGQNAFIARTVSNVDIIDIYSSL